MTLLAATLFLLLALGGVVVRKTYYFYPVKELKRKAAHHDPYFQRLYQAVSYGSSLRALLWIFIGVTSAVSFVMFARELPVWLSVLVVVVILWIGFSWLPASRVSSSAARITGWISPFVLWILNYVHPLFSRGADVLQKRYTMPVHTGLFERDDVMELLDRQQQQGDNRLSLEELEIARRALNFGDFKVHDILTSRKDLKSALADDNIGPVVIDELHKLEQRYIPVREKNKGPIVGILDISRLGLGSSGQIRDVMSDTVYYLHENDSLSEALHALLVTNCPVFVAVNSSEEYVGIVTIDALLRQLLGHVPGDDFDQYSNLSAVANRHVKATEIPEPETEADTLEEKMVE